MLHSTADLIARNRRSRTRKRNLVIGLLLVILVALFLLTLMLGQSFTPPKMSSGYSRAKTFRGASFTVGKLRLPRAVLSVLAGLSFGLGGVAFQLMLRNSLASPDIIGISSGASAAAVLQSLCCR